jgi:AcrR family transcriptional regulator
MIKMLSNMPFSKITVNEICAEALVSRSTFYTHYKDKYDLVSHCLDELTRQLFAETQEQSVREQLHSLLVRISQDSRAFKNLIVADYDAELMELLRVNFLETFCQQQKHLDGEIIFPHPREASATFYAAGFTGAVMLWIRSNLSYSIDEMTACLWALMSKKEEDACS